MNISTTIVISNYNYRRFIDSCINSCLAQTVPCQVIIVDDKSTDGSWKYIEQVAKRSHLHHPVLGVRLSKNSGGNARGKNVGICMAQTEFVTCLDSDDMLLPNSVFCREEIIKQKGVDWVHGKAAIVETEARYEVILGNMSKYRKGYFLNYSPEMLSRHDDDMMWHLGVEASTVLARRSVYEKVGLYDEDLKWKIDREMWYRLLRHNCKKCFLQQEVSIYRKHRSQITRNPRKKNVDLVNAMFSQKTAERSKFISTENTQMIDSYDIYEFVDIVVGKVENVV